MMSYLTKITIFGLLVLLASCEKENIEIPSENPALISFAPQWQEIVESSTRGTPATDVSKMTTMGIFAYYTGSNTWAEAEATATSGYMHNLQVTQSNGAWGYSPAKYWPTGNVTLFAYAPHATADNGITVQATPFTGVPKIQYTVPKNCTEQVDLMVAGRQEDRSSGAVTMPMKHALACVGFRMKGDFFEKITKIAVKGVSVSGTLSLDNTDGALPQWSDLATADDTEYTSGVKAGFTISSTMTDAMNADGYLMMIPQVLGAGAKLIINVDGVNQEVSLSGREWKAGESYSYDLDISYDPILVGYFGGWDGTKYTKQLQVDWLSAASEFIAWGTENIVTGALNMYSGSFDVDMLLKQPLLSSYPAAEYCYLMNDVNKDGVVNPADGEKVEWYLPSFAQLMAIWIVGEVAIPEEPYIVSKDYWSATELKGAGAKTHSLIVNLESGGTNNSSKGSGHHVRCVRDVMP